MNEIHIHLHLSLPETTPTKRMSCCKPDLSPAMVGGPLVENEFPCPATAGTYTAKCTRHADGSCEKFMN